MQKKGHHFETLAYHYLKKKGLTFIKKNYSCPFGEIDLIMNDKNQQSVFIEVRFRQHFNYGHVVESVDCKKREKLKQTAMWYCHHFPTHHYRFDIVGITPKTSDSYNIYWVKNAFK